MGEHDRSFGRNQTVYNPWHYVPVLARKPGALRNGAPFKDWVLPAAMERVRRKLAGVADGNRQMVDILTAVLTDGLSAVEAACAEAINHGVHSADVVLNILARQREPGPPETILTPAALMLRHAFGATDAADAVEAAVEAAVVDGVRTPDIAGGGPFVGTREATDAVVDRLARRATAAA